MPPKRNKKGKALKSTKEEVKPKSKRFRKDEETEESSDEEIKLKTKHSKKDEREKEEINSNSKEEQQDEGKQETKKKMSTYTKRASTIIMNPQPTNEIITVILNPEQMIDDEKVKKF